MTETTTSSRYNIFRDDTLTEAQASLMLDLDSAQSRLLRALEVVRKDAEQAIDRARQGQRASYGSQIFGQYVVDAEQAAKEVELLAQFARRQGVPLEKIHLVLTQAS